MDEVVDKLKCPKDSRHYEKLGVQKLKWNDFNKYYYLFLFTKWSCLYWLVLIVLLPTTELLGPDSPAFCTFRLNLVG